MENDTLTLQEAADLLGKSTQTVRRLIKKGDLQAQRIDTPQGFQYAVLKSSMVARFPRMMGVAAQPVPQPQVVAAPIQEVPVQPNPQASPVHYDWSPFLISQNGSSVPMQKNEPVETAEDFLENDYFELQPFPAQSKVDSDFVSSRQLLELVQSSHKEKLMLITILERLQAELEREHKRPKTLLQWIGATLKSVFGKREKND